MKKAFYFVQLLRNFENFPLKALAFEYFLTEEWLVEVQNPRKKIQQTVCAI